MVIYYQYTSSSVVFLMIDDTSIGCGLKKKPTHPDDNYLVGIAIIVLSLVGLFSSYCYWDSIEETSNEEQLKTGFPFFVRVDGHNLDSEQGCFFIIQHSCSAEIDPNEYLFWVSEGSSSDYSIPKKGKILDFNIRSYSENGTPMGGDRNGSYDWSQDGELWSFHEQIAFDMPKPDMRINITNNYYYNVLIMNSKGEVLESDSFQYVEGEWKGKRELEQIRVSSEGNNIPIVTGIASLLILICSSIVYFKKLKSK